MCLPQSCEGLCKILEGAASVTDLDHTVRNISQAVCIKSFAETYIISFNFHFSALKTTGLKTALKTSVADLLVALLGYVIALFGRRPPMQDYL